MITDAEHTKIYDIVDKFGGDNKVELRRLIIELLSRHDSKMLTKIKKVLGSN